MDKKKRVLRKTGIILFWLALWYGLAAAVDNNIILVTPLETLKELAGMLAEGDFYVSAARSLSRIGLGFAGGFLAAVLLAVGSSRYPFLEEFLAPVMNLIKTIPVASFVVLLLIWWGASFLAVAICFLVVLPNIYISTLEGLKSTDRKLLQMAQVFRMPFWNRLFYIYRPALKPFLYGSLKLSLGMCWKSGVAAEVIATPDYSIGEQLYLSKVYLNTAGVFAWTTAIILLSVMFEKLILWLAEKFFRWKPACKGAAPASKKISEQDSERVLLRMKAIHLEDVDKSFGDQSILEHVNADYEPGKTYFLTSPSGSGKTTLLLLIAGVIKPDNGVLKAPETVSMVFQEDRLCEEEDAVKNVELVTGDPESARTALLKLLPAEALNKPCAQLSGGMKRRVSIVRAMEADSEAVLLDEPYTGLDADTQRQTERYIRERRNGRTMVIATHILAKEE